MSLVWRTGTTDDAGRGPMTPEDAFPFRIIVTIVLSLGLIYFVLIASTLRRYGEMMDQAWQRRIVDWINDTVTMVPYGVTGRGHIPTTPVPLVDPPTEYQPPADSGFGTTYKIYSTDRPYPKSKIPTNSYKSFFTRSARTRLPDSSYKFPLRPPTSHAEMMDQACHRRIVDWINDTDQVAPVPYSVAGSGHIPTTPVPLVDPPTEYQPPAESGFGTTFNVYSTDKPYPKSKSPTISCKSSSARSHILHSSYNLKFPLRPPTPHAEFSFSKIVQEHNHGTDDKHRIIVWQRASKDENLIRDLKIPINASTPPLQFSSVSAPSLAHPLHLLGPVADEVYDKMVIDPSLSQVPIKVARLLLLSFEGDYPLDVPPSEDELNACHMTKELWKELQTVSVTSLKYLSFRSTIKLQEAQQFWYPLHPENMAPTLHKWNTKIFFRHGAQIALCEAFTDAESSRFTLYCFSSAKALPPAERDNYSLPEDLQRLHIFVFSPPPNNTVVVDTPILVTEDNHADRHGAREISLRSSDPDVSGDKV